MPLFSLSLCQIILAFVSASILHKLTVNRFFLRWLARRKFTCYVPPSNAELKSILNKKPPKAKHQKRRRTQEQTTDDSGNEIIKFNTKDIDNLKLTTTILSARDFNLLEYANDLEWLADLALISLFNYFVTELLFRFYPGTRDTNFSLIWAILVIYYSVKTLWKLSTFYFIHENTIGERSVCIVSGCFFLFAALVILSMKEDYLDFGLENAYKSFNRSASQFVSRNNLSSDKDRPASRPVSFLLIKLTISIICALVGAAFTFPGLKYGQLHNTLLRRPETTAFEILLYNLNFSTSLFISFLWLKPFYKEIFKHSSEPGYNTFRLYVVITVSIFRFLLMPKYLRCFLRAGNKQVKNLRKVGGIITNKVLRVAVSGVVGYANVVTLQYMAPILMCLFTTLMLKSLGGLYWNPVGKPVMGLYDEASCLEAPGSRGTYVNGTRIFTFSDMIDFTQFKRIFSSNVFKGLLSFATWWLHFTWFCTSAAGVFYHNNLELDD